MATIMGLVMILLEGLMHPMPVWAWLATIALLGVCAVGIRSQWGIRDIDYLQEMIPHHSMALFTSQHRLKNPNTGPSVRQLASEIVKTQEDEITLMTNMVALFV